MARLINGRIVGKLKYSAFGEVYVTRNGVVRSLATKHQNPTNSFPNFLRQVRVRHAAALWNILKEDIRSNFDLERPYAAFTGDASRSPALFGIPKSWKIRGICPVAPILVSYGDILPITYDHESEATSINLGRLRITGDTTYNEFVRAIICEANENLGFQLGDVLTLLYISQRDKDGLPSLSVCKSSVVLDFQDGLLSDIAPTFFTLVKSAPVGVSDYALTVDKLLRDCAFAFIHAGMRGSQVMHSTQHLICRTDPWELTEHLVKSEFENS